jgi:hypothetical protein
MKVKITAHMGQLVIETTPPFTETDEFFPDSPTRFGCVVRDTRKNLGVSEEALELLGSIPPSPDDVGGVMWFASKDGNHNFGWMGGPLCLMDPKEMDGDRDYRVYRDECVVIPNDPPSEAVVVINRISEKQKEA